MGLFEQSDILDFSVPPRGQDISSVRDWKKLDSPREISSVTTYSTSSICFSMRVPHLPLLWYEMRTRRSIKTIASIIICLRASAFSAEPRDWDENTCINLLPLAILSRSMPAIHLFIGQGEFITSLAQEPIVEAILRGDTELLDAIFTAMGHPDKVNRFVNTLTARSIRIPALLSHSPLASFLESFPADTSFPHIFPLALFHVLPSTELYTERLLEASLALIKAGVQLKFYHTAERACARIASCIRIEDESENIKLLQRFMTIFSKQQLNQILFECCVQVQSTYCELIPLALGAGADPNFFDEKSKRSCISKLVHSEQPDLFVIELLLKTGMSFLTSMGSSEDDMLMHCLNCKKTNILELFMRYGLDRSRLHHLSHQQGLLYRSIIEVDLDRVLFLFNQIGVDVNGRLPSSHFPTPLLAAIAHCRPTSDKFDMVMQIVTQGADINDRGHHDSPALPEVVLDRAIRAGIPSDNGIAFLRLTENFVQWGADFDLTLFDRVLVYLLELFSFCHTGTMIAIRITPLTAHVGYDLVYSRTANSPLPAHAGYDVVYSRAANSLREDCISSLMRTFRRMLRNKALSRSARDHYISEVHKLHKRMLVKRQSRAIDDDRSNTYLFAEHIVNILSILAPPSIPRPFSGSAPSSPPVTGHEQTFKNLEDKCSAILVDFLLQKSQTAKGLGWAQSFPLYPVLKLGRRFHDGILRHCSSISHIDWDPIVMLGINEAISKGDDESMRAGYGLLMNKATT